MKEQPAPESSSAPLGLSAPHLRSREELQARVDELVAFVETASIGLHWVGPDGLIQWANAAELEMLGYTEEEYVGHPVTEFHVDAPVIEDILARLQRGERVYQEHARLRCKDGSIKHVLIDSSVLWKDGRFVHSQCFTRDFTDYHRVISDLQCLHKLSARITAANDLPEVMSAVLTAAMEIHHTDKGVLSVASSDRDGLVIGASHGITADALEVISFVNRGAGACGGSFDRRERVFVEDVEIDPIYENYRDWARQIGIRAVHCTPLITSEGKIVGVLSVYFPGPHRPGEREIRLMDLLARQAADVLEANRLRAQLETELLERQRAQADTQQLAAIVAGSDDAIMGLTLDGIITSWNAGAERLYGYTADEIVGHSVRKLVPAVVDDEESTLLERIRAGEHIHHYETVRQRKNGSIVDISLTVSPVRDSEGRLIGASKIARDISDKRRAEQALRRQHQELADLDAKKNEFLAMLGHELRNPLAAIQNAAELLNEEHDYATRRWATGAVQRQINQLAHLVNDLVDVARITRGRIELRRDTIDIRPILERALETVRPLMVERQHRIEVSMPQATLLISADSARLEQLLVNLLSNSAKYTDHGGFIRVVVSHERDRVVVSVRDNGIGIKAELLPHIFDLFVQDPRGIDRARGGLGIGLALARRVAEMHGGTLVAESDGPGQGSTFTLRLPALASGTPLPANPTSKAGQPPASLPTHRVLIVDDNQDSARALARLLERRGQQVRVVHDGLAALAIAQHFEPDVFLLDLGLPGIDGYQLASELQRTGFSGALFVAISGYALPQDLERSRSVGFEYHLAKPVDIERVTEVLRSGPRPRRPSMQS